MKENDRMQDVLEQAEDAYFEVLMRAYAERMGEEYLEESKRLNADPTFDYPEELDRKCLALIDRAGKQESRVNLRRRLKRIANVAAIIIAVIALSGTVLFVSVEAFRSETINYLIRTFVRDEGTTARVTEASADEFGITWKPFGYRIESVKHGDSVERVFYSKKDGPRFTLIRMFTNSSITIDTELSEADYVEFLNIQAYYTEKDGNHSLTWSDSELNSVFTLESRELDMRELIDLGISFYE